MNREYGDAARELDAALKSTPCCDTAFRYELAGELMKLHRTSDAYLQMKEALALKAKQPEYLQRMARVLLDLEDPVAAAGFLQAAPPRQLETRLLSGRVSLAQGEYRRAVETLRGVLAEKNDFTEARIYLALARARQGDWQEAISTLEKLAAERPTEPQIEKAQGTVLLWKGDYPKELFKREYRKPYVIEEQI